MLTTTIAGSGRVVLSSYFQRLNSEEPHWNGTREGIPSYTYPNVRDIREFGIGYHVPFGQLESAAAGIGHLNLVEPSEPAPFIRTEGTTVPSFAVELLRVFCGEDRVSVSGRGGRTAIGSALHFSMSGGTVTLNYPGPMSSFRFYPFLEVLRSYDALKADRTPAIPLASFKGKIVLVGVIAEGRSIFVNTPISPRYPSLGVHASFIDNALQGRFVTRTDNLILYLICLLIGCSSAGFVILQQSLVGRVFAFALPLLVAGLSFVLFVSSAYVLPVVAVICVGIGSGATALFYKQLLAGKQVGMLLAEKDVIVNQLKEKEAKVALLESELLELEAATSTDRTAELLEEIRKYKGEIHALSTRADDMEEYRADELEEESSVEDFEGIIHDRSGKMKPVIEFVGKIAGSDAPVLILGESGTGKELIARAIHKRSSRSGHPFIAVNCGALAESLLESELFGHEKGAFTGAMKDKLGRFELADGGTILLDEIGDVSGTFQLKLLRVLQEGEFERVGGTKTIKVNVRILAATNRDLKQDVKVKRFREDLFYRLNVLSVNLPPLREREGDIPLLINYFLGRDGGGMRPSRNVMDALRAYSWRGNIREMESVIVRAVLLAKAEGRSLVSLKDLSEEVVAATQGALALEDQILESLREKGFSRSSVSETADELGGLNRGTVAEYLRGQSLKLFVEHGFNVEKTVQHLSLSTDPDVNERVKKKLHEYLTNIADIVNPSIPWGENVPALKPKTKNLPQRYHAYLQQVAETCYRGIWRL